jgi:hypothetical protein
MGVYYISACHDCKEKAEWNKTSSHQAYVWHIHYFKKLHPEHNVRFSNDYDDDFYDQVWKYKNIKIESKGVGLC